MNQSVYMMSHKLASLEKCFCEFFHRVPDRKEQSFGLFAVGHVELFGRPAKAQQLGDSGQFLATPTCSAEPTIPVEFGDPINTPEAILAKSDSFGCYPRVCEYPMRIDQLLGNHTHLLPAPTSRRR